MLIIKKTNNTLALLTFFSSAPVFPCSTHVCSPLICSWPEVSAQSVSGHEVLLHSTCELDKLEKHMMTP